MIKLISLYITVFSISAFSATISDFNLREYGTDNIVNLDQITKNKKVVINFWATWCKSCIEELTVLENLKIKYPETIFIAINAGEKKKKIKRFLRKYTFSYQILMDKNKRFSKSVGVLSLPQTFVIGKNREILYKGVIPPSKI